MCRTFLAFLATLLFIQLAQANPPNILIIMADDLGWNDVGYHGSEIQTPRLDKLAAGGLVLDRFYAQPVCSSTRAALMTGRAPLRLGIVRPVSKHIETGLPLAETTMADIFNSAGYQTALIGKWHLGFKGDYHPNNRGFDYFYGHVSGGIGYWDHVHGGGLDWQRNGETLREEGYATHLIAKDAIGVIKNRDRHKPLFLVASFNAPHLPNEAPESAVAQYAEIDDPKRQVHAAMVTELDHAIGQLIDTLAHEEILGNTLVWFFSDNGGLNPDTVPPPRMDMIKQLINMYGRPLPLPMLEFLRRNFEDGRGDNGQLRLGKGSIYEGGTRVPSLLYWQGILKPTTSTSMVSIQDVLPTLLAATGVPPADINFDGQSRWPDLTAAGSNPPPNYLAQGDEGIALYQFPWKLVSLRHGRKELYNLLADPTEISDLSVTEKARVDRMQSVIDAFPRGKSIHMPQKMVIQDPDFFGGKEDRQPWSEI